MKKNFKDANPALAFIGAAEPPVREAPESAYAIVPENDSPVKNEDDYTDADTHTDTYANAYTYAHTQRETKTRRLQILLRPSLYQAIARLAGESGLSVNETIHAALEAYLLVDGNNGNHI